MESLLGEYEVCSHQTIITDKKGSTFDMIVDRTQIFIGVSGGRFPWSRYGIANRRKRRSVHARPE